VVHGDGTTGGWHEGMGVVSERLEAVHRISKTWMRGSADFGGSVDPCFLENILLSWTVPSFLATTKRY
jgi:hypothetical protein